MSVRRAADEHKNPTSTLHDNFSSKVGAKSGTWAYLTFQDHFQLYHFYYIVSITTTACIELQLKSWSPQASFPNNVCQYLILNT